jgi:hypothetical protein
MRQQCSGVRTRQISFIRDHNVSLILQSAIWSHHSIICNYTSGNPHVIWSPARDSNPESSDSQSDRIVMMASAEIHPVDLAAATQQAKPTVFTATDESHPPTKAGNNELTSHRTQQVTKTMLPTRNTKLLKLSPQPQTPNDTRQLRLHLTHPIGPPRQPIMALLATTTMLPN